MHAFTYPERLKLLCLERLEERRIRADILFVYKLFRPYSPPSRRLFILCESTCTRGHPYQLFYHDIQLMFVSVLSPTASCKFGMSSQLSPILLVSSIHLSEHLRVLTLLLTVTFKSLFYRFAFCVTSWRCVRG